MEKDLATKIWLMQEALKAVPADLRERANIVDDTPPPTDRPWPLYMTPPVKDFNLKDYVGRDGSAVDTSKK